MKMWIEAGCIGLLLVNVAMHGWIMVNEDHHEEACWENIGEVRLEAAYQEYLTIMDERDPTISAELREKVGEVIHPCEEVGEEPFNRWVKEH